LQCLDMGRTFSLYWTSITVPHLIYQPWALGAMTKEKHPNVLMF